MSTRDAVEAALNAYGAAESELGALYVHHKHSDADLAEIDGQAFIVNNARARLLDLIAPPAPGGVTITEAEIVAGSDALCAIFRYTFDFWTDRRDYVEAAKAVLEAAKRAALAAAR
jgi:hypothetical protein